jgi:signal transduction histidine kinase
VGIIDPVKRTLGVPEGLRPKRLDLALIGTAAIMTMVTVVIIAEPAFGVNRDRVLDAATSSITALAAGALALFTMPRFRESGRLSLLLLASAFALIATSSGVTALIGMLTWLERELGLSRMNAAQYPLYVSGVTRILVGSLFLAAGVAAIKRLRVGTDRASYRVLAPTAILALLTAILYPIRDLLPSLIDEGGMQILRGPEPISEIPGISAMLILGVIVGVVLLASAAVLFRFSYVGEGIVSEAFLAVGLVIFAFAELQYAFYPSVFTWLVAPSDFIRLAAIGVLLLGIVSEQRSDLRALKAAYAQLDRLRVTEAERATLEERARLGREIHDGLAQHLWFAKLKFERLAGSVPDQDRELAAEVGQALDSAIVEARQALITMRTSLEADLPLTDMLRRTVDDFGQRSGIHVEFTPGAGLPSAIPPRQQIELLRVVQEALTNVSKHADATVVRVNATVKGRELTVMVVDNGKGFDPAGAADRGLGLLGMEERARLMGGSLRVQSQTQGGASVVLTVPLLVSEWVPAATEEVPSLETLSPAGPPPVDGATIVSRPVP